MTRNQIEVGKLYRAKVSGRIVHVRIARDSGFAMRRGRELHQGWDAINTMTGRQIHIGSPQRLRGAISDATSAQSVRERLDAALRELDATGR